MALFFQTLEYDGTEKSFADWGFSLEGIEGYKLNQAPDTWTATITTTNILTEADAPTFPHWAQVIVRVNRESVNGAPDSFSGGLVKFVGKRIGQPMQITAGGHGVAYTFENAWGDFQKTQYHQVYKGGSGSTFTIPEIVLFTSTAVTTGQKQISLGDQIQALLQFLLDTYAAQGFDAPFQYVGRDLNAGAIDLNTAGPFGTPNENTDFFGQSYNYSLNSETTIDASLFRMFLPTQITKPAFISDLLIQCLSILPRANVWFDYTTEDGSGNPLPTIHVEMVDHMAAVNVPICDGVSFKSLAIQPRPDLKARAVVITYRITSTIDGSDLVNYVQDKCGPNGNNSVLDPSFGPFVFSDLIDLQGAQATTATAHLSVSPVLAIADNGGTTHAIKRDWWSSKQGGEQSKLDDFRVRFQKLGVDINGKLPGETGYIPTHIATEIPDAIIIDAATGDELTTADLIAAGFCDAGGNLVLNRLVRGSYHSWMKRGDGQPVVARKVKIAARMTYATYDAEGSSELDTSGNLTHKPNSVEHHHNCEITNGVSGSYSTIASATPGEGYITGAGGIAEFLFNLLNVVQYDGNFAKVEASFANAGDAAFLHPGRKVNLTNGATAWQTMNAQIQEVREIYVLNETHIRIGVARHLNAGQLSSLLNMWRFRRTWFNPAMRSNSAISGAAVDLAVASGNANTTEGLQNQSAVTFFDYSAQPSGSTPGTASSKVVIDSTHITANKNLN